MCHRIHICIQRIRNNVTKTRDNNPSDGCVSKRGGQDAILPLEALVNNSFMMS